MPTTATTASVAQRLLPYRCQSLAGEGGGELDMRRPEKLVDAHDPSQPKTAICQNPRVPCETCRITGNISNPPELRFRQHFCLSERAGTRRVEHECVKAVQFSRCERPLEQVALFRRDRPEA